MKRDEVADYLLTHTGGDESDPWQAGHNYAMREAARLVREKWDEVPPPVSSGEAGAGEGRERLFATRGSNGDALHHHRTNQAGKAVKDHKFTEDCACDPTPTGPAPVVTPSAEDGA